MIVFDGQTYEDDETPWDLGSFTAVEVDGNARKYRGLSKDVDKLPHYVATGSSALCLDTGDLYMYLESTDTWYLQ